MTVPAANPAPNAETPPAGPEVSKDAHVKGFEHLADDESSWTRKNARGYEILEKPCGTKKHIKVIAIGAGASGLDFAHAVDTRMENIELVIYERLPEVSGCWYTSRYPGCACDTAVNYQFSWGNTVWDKFYASAEEIFAYFKGLAVDYDLLKYVRLEHNVVSANWNDETAKWHVIVRGPDGKDVEDTCDVFVNASGFLSNWEWPKIDGLNDFKGTKVHGAAWPKDLDVKDKKVAVVGSGSTAVQIVSTIRPLVKELYTWVRSPIWVTPAFGQAYAGPNGQNFKYSEETKKNFKENPQELLLYRKMIEDELNRRFRFLLKGTAEQQYAVTIADKLMRERLGNNEKLIEKIVPTNFGIGCRRPTPGLGYLESLVAENATTYTESIKKITPDGFLDPDGKEVKVDIIVTATGLNTSFRPRFPLVAFGKDLSELWKDFPNCYQGIAAPEFPNFLIYFGPHGPYAHGSALPVAESYTEYFIQMLTKMQKENIRTFMPNQRATDDFDEHRELFLKRTVWNAPCSAWFTSTNKQGKSALLYPGSRIHLMENMRNPRFEDWDYTWESGNRFNYYGNGFHVREFDGRDLTWYYGLLGKEDSEPDYSEAVGKYATKK